MAEIVKMCDMPVNIAVLVFKMLNEGRITISRLNNANVIITDTNPMNLRYPEGWYYAKGNFRNKHTSTIGIYHEINMVTSNGVSWNFFCKDSSLY